MKISKYISDIELLDGTILNSGHIATRYRSRCLIPERFRSYTFGMKTAISLPNALFERAERFARRFKKSRSQLYAEAIIEYLERHAPEAVTDAMNSACEKLEYADSSFAVTAAKRLSSQEQW